MENEVRAEIDWMLRFQAGEDGAFDRLVEVYSRRIYTFIYRMLQNLHEAEDASQEVFMRAFRGRQAYRAQAGLTAWMYTIARRVCLNRLRFQKRHPLENLDTENEAGTGAGDVATAKSADALEELITEEKSRRVRAALATLPDNERQALILDHWEGLSHEEIGQVLGNKSVSAVKSMLFRARRRLHEALEPDFPQAPIQEVNRI